RCGFPDMSRHVPTRIVNSVMWGIYGKGKKKIFEKFCISDKKRTFASRLLSKFEKILSDWGLASIIKACLIVCNLSD
ncbi:MAG: hypothetical protein J1E02_04270, partial [Coprobacter sp.]|nr:hypothetical protein [Coprobacter sp.]